MRSVPGPDFLYCAFLCPAAFQLSHPGFCQMETSIMDGALFDIYNRCQPLVNMINAILSSSKAKIPFRMEQDSLLSKHR
jgi:hypothetical protein